MNRYTDLDGKILSAYASSNIIIRGIDALLDTNKFIWLSSMGMLDTLIIMGVDASIWEDYDG